jgi:hypothetical protein
MCQHVETARSMVPPALHHAMAERWSGEAAAVVAEWCGATPLFSPLSIIVNPYKKCSV